MKLSEVGGLGLNESSIFRHQNVHEDVIGLLGVEPMLEKCVAGRLSCENAFLKLRLS